MSWYRFTDLAHPTCCRRSAWVPVGQVASVAACQEFEGHILVINKHSFLAAESAALELTALKGASQDCYRHRQTAQGIGRQRFNSIDL